MDAPPGGPGYRQGPSRLFALVEGEQRLAWKLVDQYVGHPDVVGGIMAEFKSVHLGREEHLTLQPSQRRALADHEVSKMVQHDSVVDTLDPS